MSALEPGAIFAGYTIERLLGVGGMGEVYVARHPRLPRSDALKVLAAPLAQDANYRQRFAREADLAASLSHHHIVSVHDRGEDGGRLWIALEMIDGTDLSDVLDAANGGLAIGEVLRVVGAVADALDFANARGLVHRDVKPANVLLSSAGGVLLTDFGIARMGPESSDLTGTGIALGTVAYASPEQMQGLRIDGRSDQYSLAATAFHLLTGEQPFTGPTMVSVLMAHMSAPVPSVRNHRNLPPAVDAVLARGMAKEPEHRYGSSREFASELARALQTPAPQQQAHQQHAHRRPAPQPPQATQQLTGQSAQYAPTTARQAGPPMDQPPAGKQRSRRRILIGATALVAVVALVAAVLVVRALGGDDTDDQVQGVTPMFADLSERPTDRVWRYQDTDDMTVVGGNADLVVMADYSSLPQIDLHFVNAENGESVGDPILERADAIEDVRCEVAGTDTALCALNARGTSADKAVIIDIDSGQVVNKISGDTAVSSISKAGDRFVLVRGRGTTRTVETYNADGSQIDSYENVGLVNKATGLIAHRVDTESEALSSRYALRMVNLADGSEMLRMPLESMVALPEVQFFSDGFAVRQPEDDDSDSGTGQVQIYNLQGELTATTGPVYALPETTDIAAVGDMTTDAVSRPIVAKSAIQLAAIDPTTGEQLWEQPAGGELDEIVGVGNAFALGTVVRNSDAGALLGEADRSLLGVDGTRTASVDSTSMVQGANRSLIVTGPDRGGWEIEGLTHRPVALGGKLYHGAERLI